MMHIMLAATAPVNPFLGVAGPIAAIVIGLYIVVFIVLALAISALAALLAYFVRQKADIIKMLRPTVDAVNKTTEAVQKGIPPSDSESPLIRSIAQAPERVQQLDKQVDQLSNRVVQAAIEFRARTMQVEAVAKAFFLPGAARSELEPASHDGVLKSSELPLLAEPVTERSGVMAHDGYKPETHKTVTPSPQNVAVR